MPGDLVYYTYLNEQGSPRVDPGPLLQHGEDLTSFFFNEINRARPQVHALLLRVMAERSVQAFNREYRLPHIQVFADRNKLEKEETFELPSAARDRFLMELSIEIPGDREIQRDLLTSPRYHDTDSLLLSVSDAVVPHTELNDIGGVIQDAVHSTETLQDYVLNLCQATRRPAAYGIAVSGVDVDELVQAGVSPRGMSLLLRAARVVAWLQGREHLLPEDVRAVFRETIAHRIFLRPVYEMQRDNLMPVFIEQVLQQVATP
jgi:MoxR-like ATPase